MPPTRKRGAPGQDASPNQRTAGQQSANAKATERLRVLGRYVYTDEHFQPLFRVERVLRPGQEQRTFRQHRHAGGRWVSGAGCMKGVRVVPYHLPDVLMAVEEGEAIWIAEGEKDVHALDRTGVIATCNPGGALKWPKDFAAYFKEAHVVIVADKDDKGYEHAADVANKLHFVAASILFVEAAAGKDSADHVDAGLSVEDFVDADPQALAAARRRLRKPAASPRARAQVAGADAAAEACAQRALTQLFSNVPPGSLHNGRAATAIWLAQQLRDVPPATAEEAMRLYADLVPARDSEGTAKPYAVGDAMASLRSALANVPEDWSPGIFSNRGLKFEAEVEAEHRRLRVRDSARKRWDAERAEADIVLPPALLTLRDELAVEDTATEYTISDLHPRGANTLLGAQFKAGKTTLLSNALKSLCDGVPFLGDYPVRPIAGRVAVWNYEVTDSQFRRWLRDVGVQRDNRAAVWNLRGYRLPLLAPYVEDYCVAWLQEREVEALIVDPFSRAYSGDENSNEEVGAFLEALDVIKRRAGVEDLFLAAHFGRVQLKEGDERVRGATRLDDWADVRWILTKEGDTRYFYAEGRDVLVPEQGLDYDAETRRLLIASGSRHEDRTTKKLEKAVRRASEVVANEPGIHAADLRKAMTGVDTNCKDQGIRGAVDCGLIEIRQEGRAHCHYPATPKKIKVGEPDA
jgi:hypothetical protein